MTDPVAFTVAGNWTGGFYELGIEGCSRALGC